MKMKMMMMDIMFTNLIIFGFFIIGKSEIYIVTIEGEPVTSYRGGVSGFEATAVESDERLDATSDSVSSYSEHLEVKHDTLLETLFEEGSYTKLYSYKHLINGFAVDISAEQAETLKRADGVKSVDKDWKVRKLTTHTPQFLGLPTGVWPTGGGFDRAGEDIVIGFIDSVPLTQSRQTWNLISRRHQRPFIVFPSHHLVDAVTSPSATRTTQSHHFSSKVAMSRLGSNDLEFQSSADTPMSEKGPSSDDVVIVNDDEENVNATKANNVVEEEINDKEEVHYTKRKRKLTSRAWEHFRAITAADGTKFYQCVHCNEKIKKPKDSSTTPLTRHIDNYCPKLKAGVGGKGQLKLNVTSGSASGSSSMVQNWKFSNTKMREVVSHMIMVHELPFNFVEYELFNVLMKEANPEFEKISRAAARQDCVSSYELGKKRIQKLLNNVKRVSITTDMWTSIQNIHYMVVTCHFVDSDFELHKYILSFVDVDPPYTGVNIYDCLYKCLKDWNIETKVATLTVDNAKTNDVVARMLLENLNLQKKLPLDGQLFHVRCCAHILNLLVQDGLSEIQHIIHNVRESVKHVGGSPGRLHLFTQLTKQLQMKNKHLILDVTTRWNATYAMLSTALEFKKVFINYADRESTYKTLPSSDDWDKVDRVCSFLSLFNEATKIISGSEYPTSNLFLSELYVIKEALDKVALNEDDCMNSMALKMKEKFDKYWGSSNLLISFGAILDPRYKMELIKFSFKIIYSEGLWEVEAQVVRNALEDLFEEYVKAHKESNDVQSNSGSGIGASASNSSSFPTSRFSMNTGSAKFAQHIRSVNTVERVKSELATYLDEGVHLCETDTNFDALKWWKENRHKYRILSKMAADILSVPITTVASESAFSAGGRVVDPHRSCLGTKMVDMLICGADWYRHYYGLHKKKIKENGDIAYIMLQ